MLGRIVMNHVDLLIGRGVKPAWAKESEDAWTARLLGLSGPGIYTLKRLTPRGDQSDATVCAHVVGEHTELEEVSIPNTRAIALRSWARAKVFGHEDLKDVCVNIIVVSHDVSAFLMQRKDNLHPNEACRGKLCPFGGGFVEYEIGYEAALRELYEEVRNVGIADQIAARMEMQPPVWLTGVQWPGEYQAHWAVCRASDAQQFAAWRESLMSGGGLAESDPALVTREEFEALHREDMANPGAHFVASTNLLIDTVLRPTRSFRLHEDIDQRKETFNPERVETPSFRREDPRCHPPKEA